jgi:hypothetical protein
MAKLYTKVNSDIRAGLGCRGNKRMDASVFFCYSGGRSPDGGLRIEASETKGGYYYKVVQITKRGDELIYTINFDREGG